MASWEREPVMGICGREGSDKAAVLAEVVARLAERGLRVAALEHAPGGAGQQTRAVGNLDLRVSALLTEHDMVLVEGDESTPVPMVWCGDRGSATAPSGIDDLRCFVSWGGQRVEPVLAAVTMRLEEAHRRRPVLGAVLIGGASRRMGFPKHLAVVGGESMLARALRAVGPSVERTLVVGAGRLPDGMQDVERVVDAADCGAGPLAGILTALRSAPRACWVVVACDMPAISGDAVEWLQGERAPGRWAVLPQSAPGRVEPLLAIYEPQARSLLEDFRAGGRMAPRELARSARVHTPPIPPALRSRWTNINRPDQLERPRDGETLSSPDEKSSV